jgi:hypothetical protein
MTHHRFLTLTLSLIVLGVLSIPAQAQDSVFPLPAPLYIVTSEGHLLRVDPENGSQEQISPEGQPVADFAISPDGAWYVYRTMSNSALVVSALNSSSGYVAEFDVSMPPDNAIPGQTIAWSPQASMIAYLVPDGVRIAALSAGDYGQPVFKTILGSGWISLRWSAFNTLVVKTATGETTRITGQPDNWTVQAGGTEAETMAAQPLAASLAPAGVTLADGRVVPGTAGAAAFDWGPLPLPVFDHLVMPNDLYYLAPDGAGNNQVWQLPGNGDFAHTLTAEPAPVMAYALAGERIAYVTQTSLVTAGLDGTNRRELASLALENSLPGLDWSPDGTQVAYTDGRGLWLVPADGSQPPRLLLQNRRDETDPGSIQVYFAPLWSPDGARLLVGVGFYEGSGFGVVDVSTGTLTLLTDASASEGTWTGDGRVIVWAWSYGYQVPGLYLFDPAAPDAPPQILLGEQYAVVDAVRSAAGRWYVLVNASTAIGPSFVQVLAANTLSGPFEFPYLYEEGVGAFLERPTLAPPRDDLPSADGAAVLVAGFRNLTYDNQGRAVGDLIVADLKNQFSVQIKTGGPVSSVQWGPSQ